MAKIGLPKGSGKRLKVREKSVKSQGILKWILSGNPVVSKGHTIYFSESSHVAYQIKADDAGSNMVANILPTDTPLTQVVGSKGQTISFTESSHVAYQIKMN